MLNSVTERVVCEEYPIFVKYASLTEHFITELVKDCLELIHRDDKGAIERVYFYNSSTSPIRMSSMLSIGNVIPVSWRS